MRRVQIALAVGLAELLSSAFPQQEPPRFRAESSVVAIDVAVMKDGQLVRGLEERDFILLEDKVPQELTDVSLESLNVAITMIVDLSSSVEPGSLREALYSVNRVEAKLQPGDSLRVLTAAGIVAELERENAAKQLGLWTAPTLADGGTRLMDAIGLALTAPAKPGSRHAVIALTDGVSTNDILDSQTVGEAARRTHAAISVVLLPGTTSRWATYWVSGVPVASAFEQSLQYLSDRSGGRFVRPSHPNEIMTLISMIVDDLRTRYVLRYVPRDTQRVGWREVEVRVTKPGRTQLTWKRGYFRR